MLDISRTRPFKTRTADATSLIPFTAEGKAAMQYLDTDGTVKAVPTTSAAVDGIFLGVNFEENITPDSQVLVQELRIPGGAPYTLELKRAPTVAADVGVFIVATGAQLTVVSGAPSAGEVQIVSGDATLTFNAAQANALVRVIYRSALTVAEAQAIYYDQPIARRAADVAGTVPIVEIGEVYTDQFDTGANWASVVNDASVEIRAIDNGIFTVGGTDGVVVNATVLSVPTADSPWLGLHLRG